jgi:uroporphyrinogen-III synthase
MSIIKAQPVVLNTRPAKQAFNLSKLLQENDFKVIELPLIEIKENLSEQVLPQCNRQIKQADLLIFISANAVIFYFKYFVVADTTQVAVIGKSTAKVFAEYAARSADIIPEKGSDSENLLQHPELNQLILQQKGKCNILIVRGQGGREYLAQQLRLKQVQVDYLEVYKRICPIYKDTYLDDLWHNIWYNKAIGFMIITSVQSLDNLLQITKKWEKKQILRSDMLVIHNNIREKALNYGFCGEILVSKNASNQAILQILLEHRAIKNQNQGD